MSRFPWASDYHCCCLTWCLREERPASWCARDSEKPELQPAGGYQSQCQGRPVCLARGPLNLMSTQSCLSSSSQTLSRKPHRVGSRGLGEPGQWISYVEKISIIYVFIIYFWLCWVFVAVQGLSLVAESGGSSLVAVCRLLIMVASRRRAQAIEHAGFRSCVHRPSCPVARGVFLDEGLNPCALHKQVDSEPLDHQRNSSIFF